MTNPLSESLLAAHAVMSPAIGGEMPQPRVATIKRPAKILVIDDEIGDRKVLEVLLAPEGYVTASVASGEEALAYIARSPPDLILLDFMMPGMDGCQLVSRLKRDPASSSIPIIMVTGMEDRSARVAALTAGAEEFLTKPIDRAELWLRVRNLLRLKAHSDFVENHSTILEAEVRARTADLQRFRTALDTTGDAIFLVNRATMRYVDANTSACNTLGYTRDELMNLGPAETSTSVLEQLERVYDAVIARHPTSELDEVILRCKDGTQLLVEARRQAYRSDSGWLVVSVLRDITERKKAEDALKLSEFSVNNASASTYWIGSDARILRVNRAACETLGYTEAELLNLAITDLDPDFPAERWPAHWRELRERKRMTFETQHRRKDGHVFPVEVDLNWFEFDGREYDFAFARDITDRKQAADQISHLSRVQAVLRGINAIILRVRNREDLFKEACRIAVNAGGFHIALIGIIDQRAMKIAPVAIAGRDERLVTTIKGILSASEGALTPMVAQAIREKQATVSNDSQNDPRVAFGRKHAEFGVRAMAILPLIVSEEVVGALALYAGEVDFFHAEEMKLLTELAGDIAFAIDHIEKGETLNYLAYYDGITGLANRGLFLERLAQYVRSAIGGGHKLAVGLIDLERFKDINDSLGRPVGDVLLKQVAEWLTHDTSDANVLARVGADQFAIVLPEAREEGDIARFLEKTLESFVDHPFQLDGKVFRIAFKSGVAIFPDDGTDADTLLRNAEAALKKAKASGDRYLFYTQEMTNAVTGRIALENQLRQALKNEEFVLHYQPKVDVLSGKITGAEALIRWNNPRTGLVPPARFIPILEETGLIHEVGRWALGRAIEDYLRWRNAGLAAVRIAVNVSPLQLRHRDFVADIKRKISIDPNAAEGLELEITESLIMENVQHSIATLQAIRALGIRIAIDDFGTGFSSLSQLSKLPIDTLKIDRSFVTDMTDGPQGLALVSTIISLSHSLKLNVVAEGVETEDQSRLLRLLNCDEIQGFLFSKPLPIELFETRYLVPSSDGKRQ